MNRFFAGVVAIALAGGLAARAVVSAGLRRSRAAAGGGGEGDRRSEPALHHVLRHRLRRRRRPDRSSTRVNIDWPRIDALANYTRTINWETGTSKETFDRKPGLNPASWKYGLGWRGGTPIQKQTAPDAHRQRRARAGTSTAKAASRWPCRPRMPSGISSTCG